MARCLSAPCPTHALKPLLGRGAHTAASTSWLGRSNGRDAMCTLLDDIAAHAPGCQCHGCGVSSFTGITVGGNQRARKLAQSAASPRQYGAAATSTTDYAFEMAASSIRDGRGVTAEVRRV